MGDASFQPEKLLDNMFTLTTNTKPTLYKQWFVWQLTIEDSIDLANKVKHVLVISFEFQFT